LSEGIKKYLDAEHPSKWLFNGKGDPGGDYGQSLPVFRRKVYHA